MFWGPLWKGGTYQIFDFDRDDHPSASSLGPALHAKRLSEMERAATNDNSHSDWFLELSLLLNPIHQVAAINELHHEIQSIQQQNK